MLNHCMVHRHSNTKETWPLNVAIINKFIDKFMIKDKFRKLRMIIKGSHGSIISPELFS